MKKLHEKQTKILELLKSNVDNPLTLIEISRLVGINSPGVLYHHLRQLEKKGYIKRNPNNSKDYLVFDAPEKKVVYINKYGMAQCGPNGSILTDTPIEQVPIASSLLRFSAFEAFIVEARGNSMKPKINSGDIVIAKKQNYAENGDTVVCVYDEVALIKQYLTIGNRIVLHSFNEAEFKLIEVEKGLLRIEGIVKNIIKYD